jgi:hypothetical protein
MPMMLCIEACRAQWLCQHPICQHFCKKGSVRFPVLSLFDGLRNGTAASIPITPQWGA